LPSTTLIGKNGDKRQSVASPIDAPPRAPPEALRTGPLRRRVEGIVLVTIVLMRIVLAR